MQSFKDLNWPTKQCATFFFKSLRLQLANLVHLLRARAARVKLMAQPVTSQLPCELNTNNPLTHTQNLRIVALNSPLNREGVMRSDSTDALDLVGRNGNTKTSSADHQGAIGFALGDEAGGGSGAGWVRSLVVAGVRADVDDFSDARVGFEVGLNLVLVAETCLLFCCQPC